MRLNHNIKNLSGINFVFLWYVSILELLAAKFLPDAIVAVCPEDTDCKTLEKYLKIEIKSCANIVNGLPSNWPNLERVFIVPFSRKKVTEFQVGMNNLVFNV